MDFRSIKRLRISCFITFIHYMHMEILELFKNLSSKELGKGNLFHNFGEKKWRLFWPDNIIGLHLFLALNFPVLFAK